MDTEILDIDQAALLLGMHPHTVYKLVKTRELPARKIGGQWRLRKADLLNLFQNPSNQDNNTPQK